MTSRNACVSHRTPIKPNLLDDAKLAQQNQQLEGFPGVEPEAVLNSLPDAAGIEREIEKTLGPSVELAKESFTPRPRKAAS